MKLAPLSLLLVGFFTAYTQCDDKIALSPKDTYIMQAAPEWATEYLPALDPYLLQLLASNLNLLCDQALHTANVERSRQAVLYRTRELVDAHKIIAIQTIPDLCNQYGQLFYQLHNTNYNLEQCTQHINQLDDTYAEPLRKALDAVTVIGRQATTFHDQDLAPHTHSALSVLQKICASLHDQNETIQRVGEIEQGEHTTLAQFYTMYTMSDTMRQKAWQLITLQMANELAHIELMRTCAQVFEACFDLAHAQLNNPEVPEEYRSLLFVE